MNFQQFEELISTLKGIQSELSRSNDLIEKTASKQSNAYEMIENWQKGLGLDNLDKD